MGKEKVQFTLTFYFKQNKAVQLDLQCFEIFIFSSLLLGLPPWENVRTIVTIRVFAIWNMRDRTGGKLASYKNLDQIKFFGMLEK